MANVELQPTATLEQVFEIIGRMKVAGELQDRRLVQLAAENEQLRGALSQRLDALEQQARELDELRAMLAGLRERAQLMVSEHGR